MHFHVGTSGYSYKEWKGSFYPAKFPQKDMLTYYTERFSMVEINNTHYRMPTASGLESWAAQVPKTFRFVLKAPQTITHFKRLKGVEEEMDDLLRTAGVLKDRLDLQARRSLRDAVELRGRRSSRTPRRASA